MNIKSAIKVRYLFEMKSLAVRLLLLAGTCTGLQYPLQYLYHYRAKVSADIPEINDQQKATSSIKANLRVYVLSPSTATFKLEDFEFLECHNCSSSEPGNASEDGHSPQFQAASEELASHVGRFSFGTDENGHFVHHAEENQWVVNFYKSIAGLFNISPLRHTFRTHNETLEGGYVEVEETVMGTCQSTYTKHQLTGVDLTHHQSYVYNHMKEDLQLSDKCEGGNHLRSLRSPGKEKQGRSIRDGKRQDSSTLSDCDVPSINRTVTRVVRSINLEECDHRVEYQLTMHGVHCSLGENQCGNLLSRNSNGVYYVRGDRNGMRLEKAEVEGSTILSPFGYKTEHLRAVTKQKLMLISVGKLSSSHPECQQGTCVSDPSMQASFVTALDAQLYGSKRMQQSISNSMSDIAGTNFSDEERKGLQNHVVALIQEAEIGIESKNISRSIRAGINIDYAMFLMMDFNTSEILNTISLIPPEQLDLVYGLLANLGNEPAVTAFLEMVKAKKVSNIREFLFVASLNNNLKFPSTLRILLDHIKSKNIEDHPFVTSQTLVNFAKLVRRLCVGSSSRRDTFMVFAREQCQQDHVLDDFQDFIIQELSHATEFWKQLVFVKTLVNLKTVEATNALLPYALGHKECDTHVRAVAMEALASWNAPTTLQQTKITLILLDLLENPAEHPTIRARALAFLASWPLSSTMWSRLALVTKNPGLKDLSALTYSLIKTTSQHEHPDAITQRQFAQHALVNAKPSSTDERLSSFKTWCRYIFKNQIGSLDCFMWIKDPSSPLPHELSVYTRRALAGLVFHGKVDFMMSNDNDNLSQIVRTLFLDNKPLSTGRNTSNIFLNMLRNGMDTEEKVREAIAGFVSFLTTTTAEVFVPLQPKVLIDLLMTISGGDNVLKGPGTLYTNPTDYSFTTFNDLGLQLFISASQPTVYHFTGSLKLSNDAPHVYKLSSFNFTQLYVSTFRVNIWSLTPWIRSKVSSGISQSTIISLPISPTLVVRTKDDEDINAGFELSLNITESKQIFFMKINLPHTVQGSVGSVNLSALEEQMKVIRSIGLAEKPYKKTWYHHPTTFYLNYEGDTPLQLDFNSLMEGNIDQLEKYIAAPNLRNFQIIGGQAGAHNLTFIFSVNKDHRERKNNSGRYVSKYGQDTFTENELCDATGKTSKSSPDRPSSQFGNVNSPQLVSFLEKLQDNAGWIERVDGYSIRGEIWKYSERVTSFEGVAATTTCYGLLNQKSVKTVFVFEKDDAKICMEMNSTAPKVNELSVLSKIFEQNLTKAINVNMWTGSACDVMIFSQNHTYSVSTDGLEMLKKNTAEAGGAASTAQSHPLWALLDGALYDNLQIFTKVADRKSWVNSSTIFGTNVVALWNKVVNKVMKIETPLSCDPEHRYTNQNLTANRNKDGTWLMMKNSLVTDEAGVLLELVDDWPKISFQSSDYIHTDYCAIRPDSIKTFDSFFVNATKHSNCSGLATTLCEDGRNEDAFAVAVSFGGGGVAATISGERKNISISVGGDGVQVNNETWNDEDYFKELNSNGEVYGHLYRRSGFFKVEILDLVEVIHMESSVYIKVADRFRGYLCGLCGDMNLEPMNDMKTPEGCLLTNPAHFLSSWKPTSGFQCITEKHFDPNSCIKEEPLSRDYYAQYQL
ncbi:von Willebrand factor type D domain [Trinorchestia longiramus]|nr:von Willebrand factor type D domain [Trinorchestia longiramus]